MSKTKAEKESKTLYTKDVPNYIWYKLSPEAKKRVCKLSKCTEFRSALTVANASNNIALRDKNGLPFHTLYYSELDNYDAFIKAVNEYYEKLTKKNPPVKELENKYKIPADIWKNLPDEAKKSITDVCERSSRNKLTTNGVSLALRNDKGFVDIEVEFAKQHRTKKQLDIFIAEVKTRFGALKEKNPSSVEEENNSKTMKKEEEIKNIYNIPENLWEKLSLEARKNITDKCKVSSTNKLTTNYYSILLRNESGDSLISNGKAVEFFIFHKDNQDKVNEFASTVNEYFDSLYKKDTTVTLTNSESHDTGKIEISDARKYISVFDYALNPRTLYSSSTVIEQNTGIGNFIPNKCGEIEEFFVDDKRISKGKAFANAVEKISVTDPVSKNKFEVLKFIIERLKQNNISTEKIIDFYEFASDPEKYLEFLQNTEETVCIAASTNSYGPSIIFVNPGDCPSTLETDSRFWINKDNYQNSKEKHLTHIGFQIDYDNLSIKERSFFVNGEPVSDSVEVLKTLSDVHKANFKELVEISKTLDKGKIPEDFAKMHETLPKFNISKKWGTISEYEISIETNLASYYKTINFRDFLNRKDLQQKLKGLTDNLCKLVLLDKKLENREDEKSIIPVQQNKFKTVAVSDSKEVAKRLAVMKISQVSQSILVNLILKNSKSGRSNELKKKLDVFFSTENGKAVLQMFTSYMLPQIGNYIPEKYREHLSSISDEFRIQAETQAAISLVDKISHLFETNAVNKFLEANPLVRIDSTHFGSIGNIDKEHEVEVEQTLAMSGMSK